MTPITLWSRKNEDKQSKQYGMFEFNHIEDEHVHQSHPTPKTEEHEKAWKRGTWQYKWAFIFNGKIIKFDPTINSINVDMDGVVADFDKFVLDRMGRTFDHAAGPGSDKEMWDFLSGIDNIYYQLEPTVYAEELLDAVMAVPAKHKQMLTAIPRRTTIPTAEIDKINFMADKLPNHPLPVVIGPYSRDKWKHIQHFGDVLIDDRKDNIEEWRKAGGIGILHDYNNHHATIQQLKAICF